MLKGTVECADLGWVLLFSCCVSFCSFQGNGEVVRVGCIYIYIFLIEMYKMYILSEGGMYFVRDLQSCGHRNNIQDVLLYNLKSLRTSTSKCNALITLQGACFWNYPYNFPLATWVATRCWNCTFTAQQCIHCVMFPNVTFYYVKWSVTLKANCRPIYSGVNFPQWLVP